MDKLTTLQTDYNMYTWRFNVFIVNVKTVNVKLVNHTPLPEPILQLRKYLQFSILLPRSNTSLLPFSHNLQYSTDNHS